MGRNFWKIEQLKGIKFSRARMPLDAINRQMRMITLVDAAMNIIMIGVWVGFKRKDGSWSCQHLIGRPLLAKNESTIPKNEMQALTAGSNLQWVVQQALQDWVYSSLVAGDSRVALCWASTENKPLAIFQRNRAIQIRRTVNLANLFHVRSDSNPSDIGTRPEKITLNDVGPGSRWEEGDIWMRQEISDVVNNGVLTPVSGLRIKDEEESEFRKGLVFEKVPEILTRGHLVTETRVSKIEERANFSKYLVLPIKFNFSSVVRIMSHVMHFVSACRKGRTVLSNMLSEGRLWFSVFVNKVEQPNSSSAHLGMVVTSGISNLAPMVESNRVNCLLNYMAKDMLMSERRKFIGSQLDRVTREPTDRFINLALLYLYRKASEEVKHFCTKEKVKQIAIDVEGVLLSKGRLLDTMNYKETGELTEIQIGDLGVRQYLPVIERYSPLAYSIADHIHWNVASHKGIETCARISRENVFIIQAHSIFKEFAHDCILCKKKRKRFLEVEMGPASDNQFLIAPPFWMCQVDLFGPVTVVVPGFERATRNRRVLEAKCWIMTAVCPTTRLVNLQVLESSTAAGWIDAFTRLACEVGCPSHVYCDQDSAGMCAFGMAEVELRDLRLQLHREKGIEFDVCPVTGHDKHGHVERVIRSVQEGFADSGMIQSIIHATGLQTICKLVENQYNNLPLGYHYARDDDNSALLKIITPNMLRVGRVNKRSLDGPIRLPKDRVEILSRVCELYDSWFKVWAESMVPKLMFKPKWFKTDKELKKGDLVYFPRTDSAIDSRWIMGVVESVTRGRDELIRVVNIRYRNSSENQDRVTERSVRKVVKLWAIDEMDVAEDLAELGRRFRLAQGVVRGASACVTENQAGLDGLRGSEGNVTSTCSCSKCCCDAHHVLSAHLRRNQLGSEPRFAMDVEVCCGAHLIEEEEEDCTASFQDALDDILSSHLSLCL